MTGAANEVGTRGQLIALTDDLRLRPEGWYVELDLDGDGTYDLLLFTFVSLGGIGRSGYPWYQGAGREFGFPPTGGSSCE